MATTDESVDAWFGTDGQVSQLRGRLFKAGCLGATVLTLFLVFVFLVYVAIDAIEPLSADPGWWVTVVVLVPVPALVLAGYYYRYDPAAGEVAYTSLGLPIATTLLAGGVVIFFRHILSPHEWLALVAATGIAVGLTELYGRVRDTDSYDRTLIAAVVFVVSIVGVPGAIPSLRTLILSLPVLPTESLSLVGTFAVPIAAVAGWHIGRVRESDRAGLLASGATVAMAALGIVAGPLVGIGAMAWIVLTAIVVVPIGLYVEQVIRRGNGISGLAFPVVIGAGVLGSALLADIVGLAGPTVWLDWSFLTEVHDTTPREAGIYPALVGSVMMVIVIAVAAFPVGVGAAIYLEEYAPNGGLLGKVVELIEINIANLAGVPSVVYGLLGLALFVKIGGLQPGIVVVGGLTIGLLILPIIIVSSQEAIQAVPDSQRQAAYGMGATRWQTVRTVVLPRAMPGILTGTILALGRAIGETAPLLMVGVAAVVRIPPRSFFGLFSAMPRQLYAWAQLAKPEFYHGVLAAGVLTLLVVLLMMNGTAILLRNKYQRRD
ncbi:phosphate ABC transporter permease PstA [Natrinema gelatinilyticum]|uniref:phosphate ABC transporter permease PstA n=1 Tax=Natrinema gelatinilyticum TaxID=2961571 RepID=UPI0020C1D348|nr:phosphate ABC transporter permease PstA [Natrinema gelatinilyticum]